ncbi:MAG: ABC transporter ATP-binding protein [Bryobacteraceae bacterium]|nr:ABC transporter ATP-binding protein [Bryobacteraceae bacterium]
MASSLSPFRRLRLWLAAERSNLWVAVVYSIAIGLLSLVVPIAVQSLVNTVAFGTLIQPLLVLTLIVLAGLGFSALLQAMRTYVVEIIQRRVFVRIASDAVERLLRVRVDAFDENHGPELVNRFFDIVTLQKAGAILLIDGLSILMQSIIGMILLAVYHPWLLAFDLLLLIAIAIVWFPLGAGAIPTAINESKAKYTIVAWLEEIARFPVTFKSASGAAYALARTDELVTNYLTYRGKHFRILLRQVVGSLALQAIASSVLLGVGGWLVIQRQLTLGQLIAAELIVTLVVSGIGKFGKQLETYYDLAAAVDKLGYITDLPLERNGGEPLPRSDQGMPVRLRGVSFSYDGRYPVLRDLEMEVAGGARVAVTGSGKSTLFDLIYGLREPDSGVVELDGHDARGIRRTDMRAQVALVRGAEIFHGTVAENLRMANGQASSAELRDALSAVGLLEVVQAMPEGFDTMLTTGGPQFSRGQAARFSIARALLARPRLLLLDECLDIIEHRPALESVLRTLFDPSKPWTVMIATTESEITGLCDSVVRLEESR